MHEFELSNLKQSILEAMSQYRDAWNGLCGSDNMHLEGRVVSMDIAMNIVKKKFQEAECKFSCMYED